MNSSSLSGSTKSQWLEAEFDQGTLIDIMKTVFKVEIMHGVYGLCGELSWEWLKLISANPTQLPEARCNIMMDDLVFRRATDCHNRRGQNILLFLHREMGIPDTQVRCSMLAFDYVALQRFKLRGGGLVIQFECPKYQNLKHAIAAYVVTPPGARLFASNVHVFDANAGEFVVAYASFEKWLTKYLFDKYGAKFVHHTKNLDRFVTDPSRW